MVDKQLFRLGSGLSDSELVSDESSSSQASKRRLISVVDPSSTDESSKTKNCRTSWQVVVPNAHSKLVNTYMVWHLNPWWKIICNGWCLWISYGQCWVLPVIIIPVVMDLLLISWLPLPVYIQEINWNRCESWPLPQTMGLRICIDIRMLTHFSLSLAAAGTETRCGFGEWDVAMWRPRVMWRYCFFFRKLQ